MKKMVPAILMIASLLSFNAQARNNGDWWADTAVAGSSLNIAQQGNKLFFAWFLYDSANKPTWLYGVGDVSGSIAPITIHTAEGQFLGQQSSVHSTQVGTGSIAFNDSGSAHFEYTVNGTSGTLNLTRFSFQAVDGSGTYAGGEVSTARNCSNSNNNGNWIDPASYSISMSNGSISITTQYSSNRCTYTGSYQQAGSKYRVINGSGSCTNGVSGTWAAENVSFDNDAFLAEISSHLTTGCIVTGRAGGIKVQSY